MCQSRSKCQRHINHTNPFLNHISVSGVDLAARRPHIPEHHDGEDLEEHGRRRIRRWESTGEDFFPLINFDISKFQLHNTTNLCFQRNQIIFTGRMPAGSCNLSPVAQSMSYI